MFRPVHRLIPALALSLVLVAPWAATAQPRNTVVRPAATGGFPSQLLAEVWGFVARLWDKEGCGIDPNGLYISGQSAQPTPPAPQEAGCGIDPSGSCLSGLTQPAQGEEGCGIDPNGLCLK
jgi:hypothetical protein